MLLEYSFITIYMIKKIGGNSERTEKQQNAN